MSLVFKKYCVYAHNPINKVNILEKGKCTSHTIACLTVFARAFCHTRVENLSAFLSQNGIYIKTKGLSSSNKLGGTT